MNQYAYPLYLVDYFVISSRLYSCETRFINNSLLEDVAFKQVHFRFGLEASDIQIKFRILFRSLSLFVIRLVGGLSFFFLFSTRLLYIVELSWTVLQNKSGSGSATSINNKILFSVVCLSVPIRLIEKLSFVGFPFYHNQCRLLGEPPSSRLLANPVSIYCLREAGFYWIRFKM